MRSYKHPLKFLSFPATPFNPLNTRKLSLELTIRPPDLLARQGKSSSYIFPNLGSQSHPLWSPATAPYSMLHQLFGADSQKTSVSLLILLTVTHLLISPLLSSHFPLQLSTHDWKPNSSNHPILILVSRHEPSPRHDRYHRRLPP